MLKSLAHGKTGENFVKQVFEAADIDVEFNEDRKTIEYYDLDCKLGRKKFQVEVKFDMMAQKTGNIAIEYYNSKSCKPSGIEVTTADLWAQIVQDGTNLTLWLASVTGLKYYIEKFKPWKNLTGVGDNNACIYLYRADQILEHQTLSPFRRLDNVDNKTVKKLIKELLK